MLPGSLPWLLDEAPTVRCPLHAQQMGASKPTQGKSALDATPSQGSASLAAWGRATHSCVAARTSGNSHRGNTRERKANEAHRGSTGRCGHCGGDVVNDTVSSCAATLRSLAHAQGPKARASALELAARARGKPNKASGHLSPWRADSPLDATPPARPAQESKCGACVRLHARSAQTGRRSRLPWAHERSPRSRAHSNPGKIQHTSQRVQQPRQRQRQPARRLGQHMARPRRCSARTAVHSGALVDRMCAMASHAQLRSLL